MNDIDCDVDSLDLVNAALLPLVRHHLSALQGTSPLGWCYAFSMATERWGEARGLALAHRTQLFLSAVLACRPVPLQTSDPLDLDCRSILTADERTLMDALTAMRSDQTPLARDLLAQLTVGRVTAAVVQSGLSLALLLETPQALVRRPQPPKLRAVS